MPILWCGLDESMPPQQPRMSLTKRLRVLKAALFQVWHERQCAECGDIWIAHGVDNGLLHSCSGCETAAFDKFVFQAEVDAHLRFGYQRRIES